MYLLCVHVLWYVKFPVLSQILGMFYTRNLLAILIYSIKVYSPSYRFLYQGFCVSLLVNNVCRIQNPHCYTFRIICAKNPYSTLDTPQVENMMD